MSDSVAVIDAETMAALKVLRGDHKKDANAVDKDFSSGLTKQIVDALAAQKDSSATQTADLIEAVRAQTAVLQKLTELLEAKQKTTVVVINKDNSKESSSSVASTAAETELETVAEMKDLEPETAALVATALEAAEEEEKVEATTALVVAEKVVEKAVKKAEPKPVAATEPEEPALPPATRGPWKFVESQDATERRSGVKKTKNGDALFGHVSGSDQLIGESFGQNWIRMRDGVNQYGKLQNPLWSAKAKKSVRSFLPKLAIGGKTTIALKSGVYYLTVKYEEEEQSSLSVEAAIVIGEISFDNTGHILASGAKWSKLLNGEKQKEGRVPPVKPKWYSSVISGAWKNGDVLRFKIDTNTNTVVYTLTASGDKESKAGWRFEKVLAFTNNPTHPKDLRAFAYCGGKGNKFSSSTVKLTIVDESTPIVRDSISTITTEVDEEKEATTTDPDPELETVAEKTGPETETPTDILAETGDTDPIVNADKAKE